MLIQTRIFPDNMTTTDPKPSTCKSYKWRKRLVLREESGDISWLQFKLPLLKSTKKTRQRGDHIANGFKERKEPHSILIFHFESMINSQGNTERACIGEMKEKVDQLMFTLLCSTSTVQSVGKKVILNFPPDTRWLFPWKKKNLSALQSSKFQRVTNKKRLY